MKKEIPGYDDIAIIGVGCVLPGAFDVPSFWENVRQGKDCIAEVPRNIWDKEEYYHPDPKTPDKTYCKIGGFVQGFSFNGLTFAIPPKVCDAMDDSQKWAITAAREALQDAGYLQKPFPREKTAVIIGNSIGGQNRIKTILRVSFPEVERAIKKTAHFQSLPPATQGQVLQELKKMYQDQFPGITEDSMPGELSNVISGRIANIFNLGGSNYTTDAACASSLAALHSAVNGLKMRDFDMAVTGGTDHSMSPDSYIKFCKIGALSGEKSCPFDAAANGFVMGEGSAIFILKRLGDAERDHDKIYAVIRSIGSSSDGKGKGITAPNVKGQILAIQRAYEIAGISPASVSLIEAHGTSTIMGDLAEVQALKEVFGPLNLPSQSLPVGSVKSQIGHLKSAAGAAGLLKVALSLHHKELPPSINLTRLNPKLELDKGPFFVNTQLRPWDKFSAPVRRAGLSSFGFGGTNFHVVVEEYRAETRKEREKSETRSSGTEIEKNSISSGSAVSVAPILPGLPQNILVAAGPTLATMLENLQKAMERGKDFDRIPSSLDGEFRVAVSFKSNEELKARAEKASHAVRNLDPKLWHTLRNQGIFFGQGKAGKVAFLFPGQGSQYINMSQALRERYPVSAGIFEEADRIMAPRLDKKLSDYIFLPNPTPERLQEAEAFLKGTRITQPAVLTVDIAIFELLKQYGIQPDMVIGHSLGEYAALVAAGIFSFENSLIAASARAKEMSDIDIEDKGIMASVFGDCATVQRVLDSVDGYVIAANINGPKQTVIGGESVAVEKALAKFKEMGIESVRLPVSHAFHTRIVAPAAPRLRKMLDQMEIGSPRIPIISNVTGTWYPTEGNVKPKVLDLLQQQIMSPVQFIQGVETLYRDGARIFLEVGPKKALSGLVGEILGSRPHLSAFCIHPKKEEMSSFNEVLALFYAQGIGTMATQESPTRVKSLEQAEKNYPLSDREEKEPVEEIHNITGEESDMHQSEERKYMELGRAVGRFLEQVNAFQTGTPSPKSVEAPLVVSGISLGLPGKNRTLFDENNFNDILTGRSFIEPLSLEDRKKMAEKQINRLIKPNEGDPIVERISSPDQVVHLAALIGKFDLEKEFGVPGDMVEAMSQTTRMALAAGILALRDAGIPLVLRYRKTSTGAQLPESWALPKEMGDETGVVFASAFPGKDSIAEEIMKFLRYEKKETILKRLGTLLSQLPSSLKNSELALQLRSWVDELNQEPSYEFQRKFLLRILPMGCGQVAEWIKARGPNTHINSACASASVALGIAHDWIRMGRCRRVIVVTADDPTGEFLREWILSGFLASGAITCEKQVELAALPFDRRRNGLIAGMGAAGIVLEHPDEVKKRGMRGLAELLGVEFRNSGFHPSRLDVEHIKEVMEGFVRKMEREYRLDRSKIASRTVFMSHETYTPARGGSASAEVESLRKIFGERFGEVVIANTKGMTGHAMATGIEEVVVVRGLQIQQIPPVVNFKEEDPEFGPLNLSKGGHYPLQYAIKFSAGFGSHLAISFFKRVEGSESRIEDDRKHEQWIRSISGQENPELEIVHKTLRVRGPEKSGKSNGNGYFNKESKRAEETPALKPQEPKKSVAPIPVISPVQKEAKKSGIEEEIVRLVAEKTGYPPEMLEMDLDLEADLGIDTVKQAEVFSMIREKYQLPRKENLQLRDYPTLKQLVGYVKENRPDLGQNEQDIPAPEKTSASIVPDRQDGIEDEIIRLVAEKTGYPPEMLEMDLDLEADLGIDTVKQAEVFSMIREKYQLPRKENLQLRDYPTLKQLVGYVKENRPDLGPSASAPGKSPRQEMVPSAPATQEARAHEGTDPVEREVLGIVSEKTGYPPEMLELDLDLEADLGIDTVKQAEVFALIREKYQLPRKENLQLRDYPTLQLLISYVKENRPSEKVEKIESLSSVVQSEEPKLEERHAIRRMVAEIVEFPLQEGPQNGLTGKRIVITADGTNGVWKTLVRKLSEKGAIPIVLTDHKEAACDDGRVILVPLDDPASLKTALDQEPGQKETFGVFHLAGLEREESLDRMDHGQWKRETARRVKSLFVLAQNVQMSLEGTSSQGSFLIGATRMGGDFGLRSYEAQTPISGGIAGLTKSLAKEMPNVRIKVCDFGSEMNDEQVANALLRETLASDRKTEIAFPQSSRSTVQVVPLPLDLDRLPRLSLDPQSVFVITGGAQGITAEIAKDLARHFRPRMLLLDLISIPEGIEKMASFTEERWLSFKEELHEELKRKHPRVTPVMLEKELGRYTKGLLAHKTVKELESLGAEVVYRPCDITDEKSIHEAIGEIGKKYGKIDVVVHGAGLEESKSLANKKIDMFSLVFDVKVDGCFNLIKSASSFGLRSLVFFSSVAGRFGNIGQTDYSAANDLLNKYAAWIVRNMPGTKALSVNWSGWAGVGMATKETIKKIFEEAGIDLIPLSVGVPMVRQEMLYAGEETEVVIAGSLGFLNQQNQIVPASRSVAAQAAQSALEQKKECFALLDRVSFHETERRLEIERKLLLEKDLYLSDHAIEGIPVFPGVMGLEAFAEAARLFFPGLSLVAMEQVKFNQALKIFKGKPVDMRVLVSSLPSADGKVCATVKLVSDFIGPNGQKMGDTRIHFEATLVLGKIGEAPAAISIPQSENIVMMDRPQIYEVLFHGPLFQVCETVCFASKQGALAQMKCDIGSLVKDMTPVWKVQPLWIELGFQAAGLYEYLDTKRFGLPHTIERISFYLPESHDPKQISCIAVPASTWNEESLFNMQVLHAGKVVLDIQGYSTVTQVSQ